jgi:hypothetical protein
MWDQWGTDMFRKILAGMPTLKALFIVLAIISFGCATTHKTLDLSSLEPLKIMRFSTPEIRKHSFPESLKAVLSPLTWIGFPSAAEDEVARDEGKALREKCSLSDYGQLVMDKFTERAPREIPGWPRMTREKTPVKKETIPWPMLKESAPPQDDYDYVSSNTLSFHVDNISLNDRGILKGLYTSVLIELHASHGDLISKKWYNYSQKQANREREIDELEANDCKLLKEEMDYAATRTVDELIEDINMLSWPK